MFWKKKEPKENVLDRVEGEKRFLVQTNETRFLFVWFNDAFYVRRITSRDPRYGLVTSLKGNKNYSVNDLDLSTEIEYFQPRLNKIVDGGFVRSIAVR
ncbi:MAG: hypothetical protein Q8Q35_03095 [Nanoarchaeota archaeon]|nr:hypothetical protein [Nanoarchaeota archaeon]